MNRVISAGAIAVLSVAGWAAPAAGQGRGQQRPGMGPPPSVTVANARQPQGFSVVLVLGDLQGGVTQDNVPPAARKALIDMKDFLPYKSYRLLDVQWTLCCGRGATPVVSRLRGADGRDYELSLAASPEASRLGVRFVLREPGGFEAGAGGSELIRELEIERMRLEGEYEASKKRAEQRYQAGTGKPPDEDQDVLQARARAANLSIKLAEARQRQSRERSLTPNHPDRIAAKSSRAVIDTSFSMDVGETVVVGTSRIAGGDKALIALLTAVPRNASTK